MVQSENGRIVASGGMALRTAFVGLGNIGAPMAHRLAAASPQTMIYDAVPAAMTQFDGTAVAADSLAEIGASADLVGVCVRDDADVHAVIAGADGLLGTMRGGVIAIHSTVRPSTVVDLADRAADHGVALIDAAVSGGADGAAKGALTAMVGGDADAIARARPLLDAYCSDVIHAGGIGAGMALKLCNNLATYVELSAALEAYRLADALGLDHTLLTSVMTNNGNLTPAMRQFTGFRRIGAEQIGSDAFLATQKALVILGEKDLALASEAAAETGTPVPVAEYVQSHFSQIVMEGLEP